MRQLAYEYAEIYGYNIVIFDTSPSLGALNRSLLTLTDGFIIPCSPDLFSIYGIRNIGNALKIWRKQFDTIFQLLSDPKRKSFPDKFVKLMGYTLFNAKKYDGLNALQLAKAHYHYASQIPETIKNFIDPEITFENSAYLSASMGKSAVIHTHNTFPSMSQKYNLPMWQLPDCGKLERGDVSTIAGNQEKYKATQSAYQIFAKDFMARVGML
ncbi:MAG: ParA family protein [Rhodobacteraceae bacterium]|nr:ParA family protein [Paracoccaceae bacterium]